MTQCRHGRGICAGRRERTGAAGRPILFELARLAAVVALPLLAVIALLLFDAARRDLAHATDDIVVDAEGWILCGAKLPPSGERLRVADLELQHAVMHEGVFRLSQPLIGRISKTWGVNGRAAGSR